jgi:hypothetical protein
MSKKNVVAALALAGVAAFALNASAGQITGESHSWGGYHWARTSNPFTLKIGDNVGTAWDSYLNTTITDWNKSTVLDLTKVAGSVSPKTCKITAGRVEVCNATYGNNGWLGIAGISVSGTHITGAYVKLNDSYFNTATYNTPEWRNLVSCQEVGHAFGLDHQDENFSNANLGTCMDYTNNPSTNQHPNQHDYDQLVSIYSHLDSTTTVGMPAPKDISPAMQNLILENVKQWGPVVKSYAKDGMLFTTHVQDFGRGKKIITHVFWVPEGNHHEH